MKKATYKSVPKIHIAVLTFLIQMSVFCLFCQNREEEHVVEKKVLPGIDVLLSDSTSMLIGKKVGLVTNPTGITSEFKSTIDALYEHPEIELVALYGPEHGVRGNTHAGVSIQHSMDPKTGVQEFSLYGVTKKPTKEMLNNVDVLLFDIQDIGSRAYTYIYTMAYVMSAAAENNIPIVVLDRPNPLGGLLVEGPVLNPQFKSFIGMYPIPYIYGLTIGELAWLFNEEFNIHANLSVIPLRNWKRDMVFDNTGLPWVPTSPHVPHSTTPFFIATTGCIGELSTINEGVGYTLPFELLGAPWMNGNEFAKVMNSKNLPEVFFRPLNYKPYYTSRKGENLQGVQIFITDYKKFKPMLTQLYCIETMLKLYPGHPVFKSSHTDMFDKALGTDKVRKDFLKGKSAAEIYQSFAVEVEKFELIRQKYFIYLEK